MVLVQGDTTSAMSAGLAAFYANAKVGHVEAGLRTHDKYSPFPEEVNRRMIGVVADVHFAPTDLARQNLLDENTPADRIVVTGNTGIDSVLYVVEKLRAKKEEPTELAFLPKGKRMVLITGHRRESFGDAFRNMCLALRDLAMAFPEIEFVYPVHLNPNVQAPVNEILGEAVLPNFHLIKPLDYVPFVAAMGKADLIITDSGGVQEEAPSLRIPVLVTREVTERPEGVKAGLVKLVGTDRAKIVHEASAILRGDSKLVTSVTNPYGDGQAAIRIRQRIESELQAAG
jgi:UDP-N-acetylglucosamine 2-epimerase (non-hydrolysing)